MIVLVLLWLLVGLFVAYMIDLAEHDTVEVRPLRGSAGRYAIRFHLRFWLGPLALVYYAIRGLIWLVIEVRKPRP